MTKQVEYRTLDRLPGYRFGDDGSYWSEWRLMGRRPSIRCGKWKRLKPSPDGRGYLCVAPLQKSVKLHALILEAFRGPCPAGMEACHGNGIPADCRLDNLRWDTPKGNTADKHQHGTFPRGVVNGRAVLNEEQVRDIRKLYATGLTQREIGEMYGLRDTTISAITRRKRWSHVA